MEILEFEDSFQEFVSLLPEPNNDENRACNNTENNYDLESFLLNQKSKSFTLNTENFRSLIECNVTTRDKDVSKIQNEPLKNIENYAEKDKINMLNELSNCDNVEQNQTKDQSEKGSSPKTSSKVKFKNVYQFKKDVVIKKLLKTIDVMNQELNKRDQLILTMEKENSILQYENTPKSNFKKSNVNEQAYFLVEISRYKQEILNYKNENEMLNEKIKFLERQLNEKNDKRDDRTCLSEYKEIISPKSSNSQKQIENTEAFNKLQKENDDLTQLNNILKFEIEKLSKQIDLIEKKKTLEKEISEKFEDLIKQKEMLEDENKSLLNKVDVLRDEMKLCLVNFEQDLSDIRNSHEKEILELKDKFNDEETKSIELIGTFESQLKDANLVIEKLDRERTFLLKTLNSSKEEKNTLIEDLEKRLKIYEKQIDQIESENEKYKQNCQSLYEMNLEQQKQIQKLFQDLEIKNESNEKSNLKKVDEVKRLRQALNLSNEKLKFQQLKYEAELYDLKKKLCKEIENLKFSNEQMTIRNGELSRSNGELRKKLQNLDNDLKDLNEKYLSTKHSNELLIKQKKDLREENERILFNHKKEIDVLEKLRDEYLKKTNAQQTSIDQMIEQVGNFQNEIETLIKRNEDLDKNLKKKLELCETYKRKYAEIKTYLKEALFQNDQSLKQKKQQEVSSKLNQNLICFINSLFKDLKLENFDNDD